MPLDPNAFRRQSIRLRARDYSSPGHYYLTLCTQDRCHLFGPISDGVMRLSDLGRAADAFWKDIPKHFPHAVLDEYVIMPNHVHGIIRIVTGEWVGTERPAREIGVSIASGLVMGGTSVLDVGANDHSPLHETHAGNHFYKIHPNHPRGTSRTIGSMVRGFKIAVTRYAKMQGVIGDVWQRGFYDHIIRHERSLERVRAYIRANPVNWNRDRNNPNRHLSYC